MLHSFVGAAAVIVGIATYLQPGDAYEAGRSAHLVEIYIGVLVGAVTFSGSIVAFGKLRGIIGSRPLLLPGRHILNLVIITLCVALGVIFHHAEVPWPDAGADIVDAGMPALLAMTGLALLLGIHMVMAIGGGDMPVVVSLLNSYSGWAAAAAGFMLSNDLLIVTGALVGSSGAILSYIMCRAMNRSIFNVMLGGFGAEAGAKPAPGRSAGRQGDRDQRQRGGRVAARRAPRRHRPGLRHGGRAGAARGQGDLVAADREGRDLPLRHPPGRGAAARPHERAAGRGERLLRHRQGDGRDQPRLPRDGGRDGDRRQRHREPERGDRYVEPDLRHAGAPGLEGGQGRHAQARHVGGLRGRRQPAGLQRQHRDAVRRRALERPEAAGGAARRASRLKIAPSARRAAAASR